ncbi:DUF1905 domain-containing protein [Lapillicoccus jejuensis]|uniref:Uncharacterized protein DUF1905 n=1 Tax=Lapillicoccus jejuensis TaxID=402171 RepID=A0A542DYJ1_9MICO|nr:DUF1905 domain-containing protein [Lapillicoccus jejuensis]TQJ08165.1 uncharacterized protein DUF1905 [Lapillicoccus jejuensis]
MADEGGWEYDVEVTVWETESFAKWAFVTLPPDVTDDIDARTARLPQRGFGAVKVEVAIGGTVWRTSVFPDTRRGGLILPLKKAVRTAEGVAVGDTVRLALRVVDA